MTGAILRRASASSGSDTWSRASFMHLSSVSWSIPYRKSDRRKRAGSMHGRQAGKGKSAFCLGRPLSHMVWPHHKDGRMTDPNAHRALEDYPSRTSADIRYSDLDRQGHVHNAVFATLSEVGRAAFMYDPE